MSAKGKHLTLLALLAAFALQTRADDQREANSLDIDSSRASSTAKNAPAVERYDPSMAVVQLDVHPKLAANLFASEVSERIGLLKSQLRADEAERLIRRFMWIKASAVALNPIPLADLAGGMVSDVIMVQQLGAVYGQPLSRENARKLITQILGARGIMV